MRHSSLSLLQTQEKEEKKTTALTPSNTHHSHMSHNDGSLAKGRHQKKTANSSTHMHTLEIDETNASLPNNGKRDTPKQ